MSVCRSGNPGSPTLSSGLTQQRALEAARCDQARLLARLQAGGTSCCPSTPSNKAAVYSSVLTQDMATRCQTPAAVQAATFPRVGVPESIRIQRTETRNVLCSVNPENPETRFAVYAPFIPPAPCPPPTAEQLNSTAPKPSYFPGCTPAPIGQRAAK
jgi:hypothetical protein